VNNTGCRLAIVSTHPIQYNAPWFRTLARQNRIQIRVFYTWSQSRQGGQFDPGFGKVVTWDIPLLDGYDHVFVENIARVPGTHHFSGIRTPSLVTEIEKWKPDALLVFGWNFQSHLHCIRYFHKRIPILFRGDSTLLDERAGLKRLMRRSFLKWVYRNIDYALYVGARNKEYFLAHGIRPAQLYFVPHAIDNARFEEPAAEYEAEALEWRRRLGIGDEEFVVLFAGKMEPKKRPDFLFRLGERIKNTEVRFLLVGNGEMESSLKEQGSADPRFVFLDFQNQKKMPVIYRMGNVFILPSGGPGETWGLAVNEAMACGRPVLVSDRAGCAPDLVQDYVNGFIFSPGEPDQCAARLQFLLDNREKTTRMGVSSGELIQSYSFQKIIASIEDLVTKL